MQSGAIMAVGHLHSAHRFVPSFFESNIHNDFQRWVFYFILYIFCYAFAFAAAYIRFLICFMLLYKFNTCRKFQFCIRLLIFFFFFFSWRYKSSWFCLAWIMLNAFSVIKMWYFIFILKLTEQFIFVVAN